MLKVRQNPFKQDEIVRFLSLTQMPVITLAAFVVVLNPAHARSAVVKPVLVVVCQWDERFGQLPNDHFYNRALIANFLGWLGVMRVDIAW